MRDINSSNCIVVFLDVLGYSEWIKSVKSPDSIFDVFKKMLSDIEVMKAKYPTSNEYFEFMEVTIWSDSVIYVIDLKNIKDEQKFVNWFLYYLSMVIVKFIADTGYFLRGAVTYGDFLQKKILHEEHRFIFSHAYVDAVKLEKEAISPRILLGKQFIDYVEEKKLISVLTKPAIQKDIYLQYYLDYYFCLYLIPKVFKEGSLKSIKDHLSEKYPDVTNEIVKKKFLCFFDYHNKHVGAIFRAHLLDEDFKNLSMKKDDVLLSLRDIGLVENTGNFFIKKGVSTNIAEILQGVSYLSMDNDKKRLLTDLIRKRVEENNNKIREYSITVHT